MSGDVESACYHDLRSARKIDSEAPVAQNREKCGLCFDDDESPEDFEKVVVGKHTSRVHVPEGYEVNSDATTPDNPRCRTDGLAAKIGAEDFGPDDLEEFARGGDAIVPTRTRSVASLVVALIRCVIGCMSQEEH